jgi:hypothetical protein
MSPEMSISSETFIFPASVDAATCLSHPVPNLTQINVIPAAGVVQHSGLSSMSLSNQGNRLLTEE